MSEQPKIGSTKIKTSLDGNTVYIFRYGYIGDQANYPVWYWSSTLRGDQARRFLQRQETKQ